MEELATSVGQTVVTLIAASDVFEDVQPDPCQAGLVDLELRCFLQEADGLQEAMELY